MSEIFTFHLVKLPFLNGSRRLFSPLKFSGLNHAESFAVMNLGESILPGARYNLTSFAFFAWWRDESSLEEFLRQPSQKIFSEGWHVRMKLYRRWGAISELQNALVDQNLVVPGKPVVAVTLARLNLRHILRFTKWGKPVEKQVRDHKGQTLALAAIRPLNTFSTLSIWKNEAEMINMVHGQGESHNLAMQERVRKDFHHEFSTMRFTPITEIGAWNGKSGFTIP